MDEGRACRALNAALVPLPEVYVGMRIPALAAAPVLIDGTGATTLNAELLERAARDDYHEWLSGAKAAGGCVRPIRLRGTIRNVDADTGGDPLRARHAGHPGQG